MYLPRYGVYTNLQVGGKSMGWISGQTKPMPPAINSAVELKVFSQTRYGKDGADVEQEYLKAIGHTAVLNSAESLNNTGNRIRKGVDNVIGRKRKTE